MKICKINTLTTYIILLLATGLFACKPIAEPKDHPKKSKEATTEPAPAPAPSAPPAPSVPAEPVSKIEDVQSIQSLESNASSYDTEASAQYIEPSVAAKEAQVQVADDGNDVVKTTPAIMRKVQQALVDAGFNPGPVDGVSGAKTTAAIESFQKRNGIPSGKLTKKTLRALGVDY